MCTGLICTCFACGQTQFKSQHHIGSFQHGGDTAENCQKKPKSPTQKKTKPKYVSLLFQSAS